MRNKFYFKFFNEVPENFFIMTILVYEVMLHELSLPIKELQF